MVFATTGIAIVSLADWLFAPVAFSCVDHLRLWSVRKRNLYQLLLAFCCFICNIWKVHGYLQNKGVKKPAGAGLFFSEDLKLCRRLCKRTCQNQLSFLPYDLCH